MRTARVLLMIGVRMIDERMIGVSESTDAGLLMEHPSMADHTSARRVSRRRSGSDRASGPAFPPIPEGNIGMQPERRLMLSVLRDALGIFRKDARAGDRSGRRRFAEAERWFASNEHEWPFSFVNICDELGLDAPGIRARLWRWRAAQTRREPTPYAWLLRLKVQGRS